MRKRDTHIYKTWMNFYKANNDKLFSCPDCFQEMTLQEYTDHHAEKEHGINKIEECIYCHDFNFLGQQRTSDYVCGHKHSCLKSYFARGKKRKWERPSVVEPDSSNTYDYCECIYFKSSEGLLNLDGRPRYSEYPSIYKDYPCDTSELENPGSYPIFDERSGLGVEACALVRMFVGGWIFYHVFLRIDAFDSFVDTMKELGSNIVVSRFWCLCDNANSTDARVRKSKTHRHMIVAVKDESKYKKLWKTVKNDSSLDEENEFSNERYCKNQKKITDLIHLVYVMYYVSNPNVNCRKVNVDDRDDTQKQHYMISKRFHKHYIGHVLTLEKDCFDKWITKQNGPKLIDGYAYTAYGHNDNRKYKINLLTIMPWKDCPVPLRNDFVLDPSGDFTLYFRENERIYFKKTYIDAELSFEDGEIRQVHSGNSLKRFLQGKDWILNRDQVLQVGVIERTTARLDDEYKEKLNKQANYYKQLLEKQLI